ncbi:hypothetical protein OIU77_012328 [Salix suchowensis]|uniref:Uncharacterized protein n=1 Tax=Salix suchowensis TaxID=1278906 RepID=A0ABQ9A3E8_9ROSI|nr:hypothetical protein OIU77_012328 [Salix suchowensis]
MLIEPWFKPPTNIVNHISLLLGLFFGGISPSHHHTFSRVINHSLHKVWNLLWVILISISGCKRVHIGLCKFFQITHYRFVGQPHVFLNRNKLDLCRDKEPKCSLRPRDGIEKIREFIVFGSSNNPTICQNNLICHNSVREQAIDMRASFNPIAINEPTNSEIIKFCNDCKRKIHRDTCPADLTHIYKRLNSSNHSLLINFKDITKS